MNKPWKTGFTALVLGTMIIQGGVPVFAADVTASVVTTPSVNYGLTNDIRAVVKSLAVESTAKGMQISATVRLYNGGNTQNRVPEHELRVRTSNGVVYTLKPSSTNKQSLQPKEIGELVYMTVVDSKELTQINEVSFVDVDLYAYPKKETTLLSMPANSVWYGTGNSELQKLNTLSWGQAFKIPGVNSELVYTPVALSMQSTSEGQTASTSSTGQASATGASTGQAAAAASTNTGQEAVVTVIVENTGSGRETLPNFRLDAQSDLKEYEGKQTESTQGVVEAGEKKYIHFTIPVENGVSPSQLVVVSTDSYTANSVTQWISTGKLGITWPTGQQSNTAATPYSIGSPIAFDPLTKVIDKKTQVSLMELHLHENPGEGYKTVVAKFQLTNTSDTPIVTPAFQTELSNANGVTYKGSRQANVISTMNPGLSYVVSYSYNVPQTENSDQIVVKVLDTQAAAPYTTTIAALQTKVQNDEVAEDTFSLYPVNLKVNSASVSSLITSQLTYSYIVKLDLDITQKDNVVVDDNFSKLRLEVVDGVGRILGSKDASFTGTNKLISGKQTLDASNIATDQLSNPISLNIYEVIQTQNGEAKRFLKNIK
jgi:hypothetical protein